ncbi:hypothetical protein ACFFRR_003202 [Megaselia abdita]
MGKIFLFLAFASVISFVTADLSCYKCQSKDGDRTCIDTLPENVCPAAKMCVTKMKDGKVERGCLEEVTCEPGECQYCDFDKCNSKVTTTPALKCHKCEDCPAELPGAAICSQGAPIDGKEKCFTKTGKDGDKTINSRGCYYDLDVQGRTDCDNNKDCNTCDTDSCNKNSTPESTQAPPVPTKEPSNDEFECIVCRSDKIDQKACADVIKDDQFKRKCELTPLVKEDKACYIQRLENNVVIRDCITTARALNYSIDKEHCKDDIQNVKCNFCESQLCNTMAPRNSGAGLKVFASLIAFTAIVAKYF